MRSATVAAVAAALAQHTGEPLYLAFNRHAIAALTADARPVNGDPDEHLAPDYPDETESERAERLKRYASGRRKR